MIDLSTSDRYSFPLNPKWILCDKSGSSEKPSFYDVFEALRANPGTKACLDTWYPPASGLQERSPGDCCECVISLYRRGLNCARH